MGKGRAGHSEGPGQGDPQDRVPLVIGHVDDVRGAAEPRVVDQDVDATHLRDRGADQPLDLFLLGDVAEEVGRAGAGELLELVGGLAQAALVDVADHHGGAFLRTAPGGGEADAGTRGGGHQDGLVLEEVVALDVTGRLSCSSPAYLIGAGAGLGSRGIPSARSEMMLR